MKEKYDHKGNPDRPTHSLEDQNEFIPRNKTAVRGASAKDTVIPEYGWRPPPADPIPVYLTEAPPKGRKLIRWASISLTVQARGQSGSPARIGGNDRQRIRMKIYNTDTTNNLLIYQESTDLDANALTLPAGKDVELFHTRAIWVAAPTGLTTAMSALWEFELEHEGGQK